MIKKIRVKDEDTSLAMAEHKFKIGQIVYFRPRKSRLPVNNAPPGPYQITERLPEAGGEVEYAIRNTYEDYERVARESELSRS
jgi:hypothetical protein